MRLGSCWDGQVCLNLCVQQERVTKVIYVYKRLEEYLILDLLDRVHYPGHVFLANISLPKTWGKSKILPPLPGNSQASLEVAKIKDLNYFDSFLGLLKSLAIIRLDRVRHGGHSKYTSASINEN